VLGRRPILAAFAAAIATVVSAKIAPALRSIHYHFRRRFDEECARWDRRRVYPEDGHRGSRRLRRKLGVDEPNRTNAPTDVFVSADLNWMDYGSQKKLVPDSTRVNLLLNQCSKAVDLPFW
jgi:hypothetical protein